MRQRLPAEVAGRWEPPSSRESGLAREGLYKSLAVEGNPSFATVVSVLRALGVRLHPEQEERVWERARRE
jgi:hypothetical protein